MRWFLIEAIQNCVTCQHCQAKAASEHQIRITRHGGRIWFVMQDKEIAWPATFETMKYRKSIFLPCFFKDMKSPTSAVQEVLKRQSGYLEGLSNSSLLSWHFIYSHSVLTCSMLSKPQSSQPFFWCCRSLAQNGALAMVRGRRRGQLHLFDAALHKRFLQWCHFFWEMPFKSRADVLCMALQ